MKVVLFAFNTRPMNTKILMLRYRPGNGRRPDWTATASLPSRHWMPRGLFANPSGGPDHVWTRAVDGPYDGYYRGVSNLSGRDFARMSDKVSCGAEEGQEKGHKPMPKAGTTEAGTP